jgi:DegV family protein with EDD domain
MAIRMVTDSTADLSAEMARTNDITIVPLTVFFGEEAYLDGVDLDNAGFYRKLQTSKELPRTSQPSPADFQKEYLRLIEEGADGILSVHLSAKLSGTYQSACIARDLLPDTVKRIPIEIIDSQSMSVGMSRAILRAAEAAQQGKNMEELKALLVDEIARTRILAVLDTLEFLKRGGRIGSAKALLGNMLGMKPILSLRDGVVVPLEQPRTRSKAYARVAQLVSEMGTIEHISIAETSEEMGLQLAEALKGVYHGTLSFCKLGAVLATHTGPGTAAVAVVLARS